MARPLYGWLLWSSCLNHYQVIEGSSDGESIDLIIHVLIGQDYLVDVCADDGASPVFLAAQEGHAECLRLLLENGACANLMVSDPLSLPLHAALEFNHVE